MGKAKGPVRTYLIMCHPGEFQVSGGVMIFINTNCYTNRLFSLSPVIRASARLALKARFSTTLTSLAERRCWKLPQQKILRRVAR